MGEIGGNPEPVRASQNQLHPTLEIVMMGLLKTNGKKMLILS